MTAVLKLAGLAMRVEKQPGRGCCTLHFKKIIEEAFTFLEISRYWNGR